MGHGHVTPNAEGTRARCGGPGICKMCSQELAQFVQQYGRIPDHMVKPIPDKIAVNGVTYAKEDNHPMVDAGCKPKLIVLGDPRQLDMFDDERTFEDCKARFSNTMNFRGFPSGFPTVPEPASEPVQIEAFPDENLDCPIQFEKHCFQFCGDACDCGKREFMDSQYAPYIGEAVDEIASSFRDEASPQE